ncbi:hypothetical protein CEXT_461231 [Caerostris extrusa]|uniref:Uncharacterized protein n=1 Tax=Caerostris extrusa TaxID=172846 RepID=A0AAV4S2X3_CAEEX|nr:hypothetical protein CEXT_461231 [Caerostris extrusa]
MLNVVDRCLAEVNVSSNVSIPRRLQGERHDNSTVQQELKRTGQISNLTVEHKICPNPCVLFDERQIHDSSDVNLKEHFLE